MRLAWLCSLLLFVPAAALAQEKNQGEKITASGKIEAVGPGYLEVVSTAGDRWQVALAPKAEVFVRGTATAEYLRPGLPIKVSGKFNKKGESVAPLSSVTVFTPREEPRERREQNAGPSAETSAFAKNLFKVEEPGATPDAPKNVKPPESWDVSTAGVVTSARGNKLTVRAPGAILKIELTEDAQVALDVADYRLARAGDSVEIQGWTYGNDVTKVVANRISITLAERLGEKTEKKP
jgi:hypothetical protein